MKPTTPPKYLSKDEAAAALGKQVRTLLDMAAKGQIQHMRVLDPVTKRKQMVFLAADVARILQEQQQRPAPGELALTRKPNWEGGSMADRLGLPAPATSKPWITLDQCEEISGLPASVLQRFILEGKLHAIDVGVRAGGRWRVKRSDLEALEGVDCSTEK